MKSKRKKLVEKFYKYHFELKHVMVLFTVLVVFQVITSFTHKYSVQQFLLKTQEWYQRDTAERLANLLATSLELLLESKIISDYNINENKEKMIQSFNIILYQQLLHQHVEELCILVKVKDEIFVIDNGMDLYSYIFENNTSFKPQKNFEDAVKHYKRIEDDLFNNEEIISILESEQNFHVFVPFVPKGEYVGAFYLGIEPDFTFITHEIHSSYNEISLIFISLMFFGLISMFFITSYTVKERDETKVVLFEERQIQLLEQMEYQKESLFTKRIYHTHHKAEKVMGFIKEDLRQITSNNFEIIIERITKYSNFISRVIYDMKWYDPPNQTIRNQLFTTNLNYVIKFLVNNVFLRVTNQDSMYSFDLKLDPNLPIVHINEFVVWEILEPLIQNSIDHNDLQNLCITVQTDYDMKSKKSIIRIMDNGSGIDEKLLSVNEQGVQLLFEENISTKNDTHDSGYGCYIAYELAKQRCGWKIQAQNIEPHGSQISIIIQH